MDTFTRFLPVHRASRTRVCAGLLGTLLPVLRFAGGEYSIIARGAENFALFWRWEPLDHALRALFLAEAGNQVALPDGAHPYWPAVVQLMAFCRPIARRTGMPGAALVGLRVQSCAMI